MRKILLLTLALWRFAAADPFTSKAHKFRADFPVKVETAKESGVHIYGNEGHGSNRYTYIIGVKETAKPMTRYQALKWLRTEAAPMRDVKDYQIREMTIAGRPALELSWIPDETPPAKLRVFTVGKRMYILTAADYDLKAVDKFLSSFRLLP